jgi:hypothetical protein
MQVYIGIDWSENKRDVRDSTISQSSASFCLVINRTLPCPPDRAIVES